MQVDTLDDEFDTTSLLIIGFIKEHCCISCEMNGPIVDLIQLFYFCEMNGPINNICIESTPTPEAMIIIDEEIHELKERNSIEPCILLIDGFLRE
eukprot:304257_1